MAKHHVLRAPIGMAAVAETLGDLKFSGMQAFALAGLLDATSGVVGERGGVSASAIRHRKRRALLKMTPEQRQQYERSRNRPLNRLRVRPKSIHQHTEGSAAV